MWVDGIEANRHHILHYGEYWNADRHNKKIRQSLGMIALMAVDAHNALHDACPAPPPLDVHMSQRVSGLFVPHNNPLIAVDNFRFAVENALRHPRTHDIERQVAMLTIEAVTLQMPFLRDGLISEK